MKRYARPLARIFVCLALAAPLAFGKSPERQQAQAQVLDHAQLLCDNCLFGTSRYYYCFALDKGTDKAADKTDQQILVAYQTTRVINWQDPSRNYLNNKVRHLWTVWTPPGETFPIAYDPKHLWVTLPNGKKVKFTRATSGNIFINSGDRCRDAAPAQTP